MRHFGLPFFGLTLPSIPGLGPSETMMDRIHREKQFEKLRRKGREGREPSPIELSIHLVTYNHRGFVLPCLKSLCLINESLNPEVNIVANHSNDGTGQLIRRKALRGDRIMDERFSLDFEDIDLGFSIKNAGWKIIYDPEAVLVHHHLRQSADGFLNRAKWEHLKSLVKFCRKHGDLRARP